MKSLPITRGDFFSVENDYRPDGVTGNIGFKRYEDPAYFEATRKAAKEKLGLDKVFVCPGKCGDCCGGNHACGNERFRGIPIVIGVH